MLDDFVSWVGDPEAYNWITLIGVSASMFTALATGYSANVDRVGRREKITAEWNFEQYPDHLRVQVTINNNSKSTIVGERICTKGPVKNILPIGVEKHPTWKANESPASIEIRSGETKNLYFIISPDPKKLRQSTSSWIGWPRSILGKSLWRSLRWRLEFGPKFSTSVLVRRRSSPMRPIRLTATKRIYEPMAIKMADTIEQKADQK